MLKKTLIIIAMCIGTFMSLIDETIMNVALPAVQNGLHTNLTGMTWALNAYTIIFVVFTIPFGRFAQRIGVNKAFLGGLFVFLVGSVVSAYSGNIDILIFGRIVQSLGAAVILPLSMIIGLSTVSIERRMVVIAALGMTQGLAGALGPSVGGILTEYSWRYIFLINVPLILIAAVLCLFTLNFRKEAINPEKIDFFGALLSAVTLFTLTLALVQGYDWHWTSPLILSLFAISLLAFVLFIWYERRIDSPMIPMQLFRHRQFNASALTITLSTIFFVGIFIVLPTYFVRIQNKTELAAALLMTPASVMIFFFSPVAAITVERLGGRIMTLIGFLSMAISVTMFATVDMDNQPQVIIACLFLGFGYGIILGSVQVLAAADFKGELLSASQSVAVVLRLVGMALATAIFISALSGNAVTARTNSISYAKNQISQMSVSQTVKNDITKQVVSQIQAEKSTATYSKNHVSNKMKAALIDENYNKLLKSQPQLALAPKDVQENAKKEVEAQVVKGIKKTNQEINTALNQIIKHTMSKFSTAFSDIYKITVPFAFVAILIAFVFKRKRETTL